MKLSFKFLIFSNNTIYNGQCIFMYDVRLVLKNCKFLRNKSFKDFNIKLFSTLIVTELILSNVSFIENLGKLGLINILNALLNINYTKFIYNKEKIHLIISKISIIHISNSTFQSENKNILKNTFYFIQGLNSNIMMNSSKIICEKSSGFLTCDSCDNIMIKNSNYSKGNAVYGGSINIIKSNIFLINSTFNDNIGEEGGVLYLIDCKINMVACQFNRNIANIGSDIFCKSINKEIEIKISSTKIEEIHHNSITLINVNAIKIYDSEFYGMKVLKNITKKNITQILKILSPKEILLYTTRIKYTMKLASIEISDVIFFCKLLILKSQFEIGHNINSGGFLSIIGKNMEFILENNKFYKGVSDINGGAINYFCEKNCSLKILKVNLFENNEAKMSGGALKLSKIILKNITNLKFRNNFASIGRSISGLAIKIKLEKYLNGKFEFIINSTKEEITLIPGKNYQFKATIFDDFGNIVHDNDNEFIKLYLDNKSKKKSFRLQDEVRKIVNGSAFFKEFTIFGELYSHIFVSFILESRKLNFTAKFYLKKCIKGDIFRDKGCWTCPQNFYSISDDQICFPCPLNAECPGGSLIIPKLGYWRFNESFSEIFKCKNELSCPFNKTNKCAEGHKGNNCFNCEYNYGKVFGGQCVNCSVNIKFYLYFYLAFIIILIQLIYKKNNISKKKIQFKLFSK